MQDKITTKFITALVFSWTVIAFFLILSPISECFYFKLPSRKAYIPIAYWLWVMAGLLFIYVKSRRYSMRKTLKAFVPVSILFHLIVLMLQSFANNTVYSSLDKRYLFCIYSVIYLVTTFALLWAAYPIFRKDVNKALLRLPLLFVPALSLFYAVYKTNKAGIVIFALCILSCIALLSLKPRLKTPVSFILKALKYIRKNKKVLVLIIFLAAFLARMTFSFILIAKTGEEYMLASDDGDSYDEIAWAMVQAPQDMVKILVKQPWPPVYMVFLGTLYKLFGRNFHIVAIIQSILGASVAVFVYLIGRRTFNETTGIIAGLLVSLSQPLIFMSSILGTEAVYIPLVVAAIFLFMDALFYNQKRAYLKMAISGVLFGLASMTLSSIVLFPILSFFFIILTGILGRSLFKRLKAGTIFLTSFLAIYFLIKTVCASETGTLEGRYESAGSYLWSRPAVHYPYEIDPDNRKFIALGIEPFKRPVESVKIIFANPKEVLCIALEVIPTRVKNFLLWSNFGSFDPIFLTNPARLPTRFSNNLEFYAILFFVMGLYFSFKNRKEMGAVIFITLFVCYYTALNAGFFICHNLRYGCPIKPFLIICLSYGLYSAGSYFLKSRSAA